MDNPQAATVGGYQPGRDGQRRRAHARPRGRRVVATVEGRSARARRPCRGWRTRRPGVADPQCRHLRVPGGARALEALPDQAVGACQTESHVGFLTRSGHPEADVRGSTAGDHRLSRDPPDDRPEPAHRATRNGTPGPTRRTQRRIGSDQRSVAHHSRRTPALPRPSRRRPPRPRTRSQQATAHPPTRRASSDRPGDRRRAHQLPPRALYPAPAR